MARVQLLTVEDRFQVGSVGLVLAPDFAVSERWKNVQELVLVVRPNGEAFEAHAQLSVVHFHVAGTQRGRAWRVVVLLRDVKKTAVPIGSQVRVSLETLNAVFGPDSFLNIHSDRY